MKLRDIHFREYGILKIEGDGSRYRLFTPVERVSDNELKLEGRIYRYEERNDSGLNELDFDHIGVFTTSKRFSDKKEVEVEVPNFYIKSHIDFYQKKPRNIHSKRNPSALAPTLTVWCGMDSEASERGLFIIIS